LPVGFSTRSNRTERVFSGVIPPEGAAALKSELQLEGVPPTQDAKISAKPLIMDCALASRDAFTAPLTGSTRSAGVAAAWSRAGEAPEME